MLTITVPETNAYDEKAEQFVTTPETTLVLEHSLVSLSKWESKWEIPFLGPAEKTDSQMVDYIRFMNLTPDVPPEIFNVLSRANMDAMSDYIKAKMTATWFPETPNRPGAKEVITAEIIYHWMIALNVPFECQSWHLNRLLTLIKVCNDKNAPKKKMSRADQIAERNALNEARKAHLNTHG